jgi:hypothetical protein
VSTGAVEQRGDLGRYPLRLLQAAPVVRRRTSTAGIEEGPGLPRASAEAPVNAARPAF